MTEDDDVTPAPKPEKVWPTHEPTRTFDYRTGKAYKKNSRGQLVEDRSGGSGRARNTDFDPHDVS